MNLTRFLHYGPVVTQRMRELIEDRSPESYDTSDVAQRELLQAHSIDMAEREYFSRRVGVVGLNAVGTSHD